MSINAASAYEAGEKPLSKWTKCAIIRAAQAQLKDCDLSGEEKNNRLNLLKLQSLPTLKNLLKYRASHHTSKMYNFTGFYYFDLDELTDPDVNFEDFLAENKVSTCKSQKKETETVRYAMFKVGFFKSRKYLIWEKYVGKIQGGYAHFSFGRKLLSGNYIEEIGPSTAKEWNLANPKPRVRISVPEKKKLLEASQQKYTFSEIVEAFMSKKFARKVFYGEENEIEFSKIVEKCIQMHISNSYYFSRLLKEKAGITACGDFFDKYVERTFLKSEKK